MHPRGAENVPPELEPRELYKPKNLLSFGEHGRIRAGYFDRYRGRTALLSGGRPRPHGRDGGLLPAQDRKSRDQRCRTLRSPCPGEAPHARQNPDRDRQGGRTLTGRPERPIASLSLEYIWEALKFQTSLPGARKAKAEQKRRVEEDPAEKQRLADLEDWERRQHEELMAKYGGEDG